MRRGCGRQGSCRSFVCDQSPLLFIRGTSSRKLNLMAYRVRCRQPGLGLRPNKASEPSQNPVRGEPGVQNQFLVTFLADSERALRQKLFLLEDGEVRMIRVNCCLCWLSAGDCLQRWRKPRQGQQQRITGEMPR
jgi:hypothetical protein